MTPTAKPEAFECYCGGDRKVNGPPRQLDGLWPRTCTRCGRTTWKADRPQANSEPDNSPVYAIADAVADAVTGRR